MKEITLVLQLQSKYWKLKELRLLILKSVCSLEADLHSIGSLVPLLGYLKNCHANIRAKGAEVVCTIVQNNPQSRQLVMDQLEDAEVREAALRCLLELARDKTGGNNCGLGEDDKKLNQILEEQIKAISLISPEDLGAAREERQLVDSL
ncbi:ATP-dependent zinc metalloprotease FTSH 10 [Hibiscus syriacus]|uniref:ATP-dependent zinc metalloprotease FTSH 10 n=1 Tax=Hibiscus syriacus TaxID=106335 RepID=A0A6A2ZXW5_HIBSY|nr:ATP-dependent zinc metalloprotease FTSH 10 [Hibiscus syriacus]